MDFNGLVSIIIPCYNSELTIEKAITCALGQSYRDCEVIVIDDGSTDGSLERIKRFGKKIKWESIPNQGACVARNRGLEFATGKWVQFLDSDDYISKYKIESQLRAAGSYSDNVLVTCGWRRFLHDCDEVGYPDESLSVPIQPEKWLIQKYLGYQMMPTHAWLTPRRLIASTEGWDHSLTKDQDGEYFDRICLLAKRIVHVPKVMAFYRTGVSNSVSSRTNRAAFESRLVSLRRGTGLLLDKCSTIEARNACANAFMRLAYDAYPRHLEVSEVALALSQSFGSASPPSEGGAAIRGIQKAFGWRVARRLQTLWRTIRYR